VTITRHFRCARTSAQHGLAASAATPNSAAPSATDPPEHLKRVLGNAPPEPARQREWARDAVAIEHYRTKHRLRPEQLTKKLAHRITGLTRALQMGQSFIERPPEPPRIEHNRENERGIDIGR